MNLSGILRISNLDRRWKLSICHDRLKRNDHCRTLRSAARRLNQSDVENGQPAAKYWSFGNKSNSPLTVARRLVSGICVTGASCGHRITLDFVKIKFGICL
jgi:hypothetical protein